MNEKPRVILTGNGFPPPIIGIEIIKKAIEVFEQYLSVNVNDVEIQFVDEYKNVTYLDGERSTNYGHYTPATKILVLKTIVYTRDKACLSYVESIALFHGLIHHCQYHIWKTLGYVEKGNMIVPCYDGHIDTGPVNQRRHEYEADLLSYKVWVEYDRQVKEQERIELEKRRIEELKRKQLEYVEYQKVVDRRIETFWKYFFPASVVIATAIIVCVLVATVLNQLSLFQLESAKTTHKAKAEMLLNEYDVVKQKINDLQEKLNEAKANNWSSLQYNYETQLTELQSNYNKKANDFNGGLETR